MAREEGVGALYKGFVPKVLRLAPGGGVLLLVVEATLGLFRQGALSVSLLAFSFSGFGLPFCSGGLCCHLGSGVLAVDVAAGVGCGRRLCPFLSSWLLLLPAFAFSVPVLPSLSLSVDADAEFGSTALGPPYI